MIFKIRVDGLSCQETEEQIRKLMSEYHTDVHWDEVSGELKIDKDVDVTDNEPFDEYEDWED